MERFPALAAFFIFTLGSITGFLLIKAPAIYSIVFFILITFQVIYYVAIKKGFRSIILFTLFLLSVFYTEYYFHIKNKFIKNILPQENVTAHIEGYIISCSSTDKNIKALIQAESIKYGKVLHETGNLKLLAILPTGSLIDKDERRFLSFKGKIKALDVMDMRSFTLLSKKISGLVFVNKINSIKLFDIKRKESLLMKTKNKIRDHLENILFLGFRKIEAQNIYSALIIGNRKNISGGIKQQFKDTGTFHIFSISGLHFATVVFSFLPFYHWSTHFLFKSIYHVIYNDNK